MNQAWVKLRMGIYNRDYLDQSATSRSFLRPRSVVVKIILATVGVFLLQLLTNNPDGLVNFTEWLVLDKDLVFRSGQIWRLLTYAFCHSEATLMHIVCNMLALFFLGRIVAQTLGEREFLWTYITAAVFSGIVQAASLAVFPSPEPTVVLGASGAVSAVFILFALHYPRLKLYIFGILPVEARWLLAVVVAYDGLGFLGLVPSIVPGGAKVGHAAHLGGLIFGLLYFRWEMNLTGWWDRFAGRIKEAKLPRHNLKIYNPVTQPEPDLSPRVDDILAKISREGEASLTPRERRILAQASEQLKNSR